MADRRAAAVAELEGRLGHVFANRALLEEALTHSSVGQGVKNAADNERQEFLGDRVLALVIAEAVLDADPDATAGDLSKRLHVMVSRDACADTARAIGVGPALRLPGGETRRGARDQQRILADAVEALIAAIYLDGGLERARAVILELWRERLDSPLDERSANPKSRLQEWAAAEGKAAPAYRLVSRTGPDHEPLFTIEVAVEGAPPARASGASRQAAEKAAALALVLALESPL